MKSTKCPAKEKKNKARNTKQEGRSKKLKWRLLSVSLLNPQIFLSAHAWTSQANILHLDQKEWIVQAVKYGFMV